MPSAHAGTYQGQFFTPAGQTISAASVRVVLAGTSTPATIYASDADYVAGTPTMPNPMTPAAEWANDTVYTTWAVVTKGRASWAALVGNQGVDPTVNPGTWASNLGHPGVDGAGNVTFLADSLLSYDVLVTVGSYTAPAFRIGLTPSAVPPIPDTVHVADPSLLAVGNLSGHRAVTVQPDQTVVYADNATATHSARVLLLTTGAAPSGTAVPLLALGEIVEPSWSWTAAQPVYLGASGVLTQTPPPPPAAFIRQVGVAISPTSIFFCPQPPIVLTV